MKEPIRKSVQSRAPLRIGLAGGGTDVSPFCDIYGGAVLSISLSRYCYNKTEHIVDPYIECIAMDSELRECFSTADLLNDNIDIRNSQSKLLVGTVQYFLKKFKVQLIGGLKVSTFADAPKGSGLGTSSTIIVSIMASLCNMFGVVISEYQLAECAFEAERLHMGLEGGYQDQYAAVFGGVNLITKNNGRILVEQMRLRPQIIKELEMTMKLFFTGVSRESAVIIESQKKSLNDVERLKAMHDLKKEATSMKEALLNADVDGLIHSLKQGWIAKKKTSDRMVNDDLNKLFEKFIQAGASAGKISGAGGGGFMLLHIPLDRLQKIKGLVREIGSVEDITISFKGVEVW